MDTITVNKARLVETLRTNREAHRAQFLTAQERYREKVIEELDTRLEQARSGGVINLGFRLPEPIDYTSAYDTALAMCEWSVSDSLELGQHDFERYVLNQWEWAGMFAANTQSYLGR